MRERGRKEREKRGKDNQEVRKMKTKRKTRRKQKKEKEKGYERERKEKEDRGWRRGYLVTSFLTSPKDFFQEEARAEIMRPKVSSLSLQISLRIESRIL